MQNSLGTEEHKQFAWERNAVESIPSVFRRFYGIDRLRTTITTRVNCKTEEEFIAFVEEEDIELPEELLDNVAGGWWWGWTPKMPSTGKPTTKPFL